MTYSSITVAVVCLLAVGSWAQEVSQGPCPNVTVVQDFDVLAYTGRWFEIEKFRNVFQVGNCSEANYGPVSDEGIVGVLNKEVVDGEISTINGTARLADSNSTEAKLLVVLNTSNGPSEAPYWVLGTDYENYAVVFSCESRVNINVQFSWVLARNRTLSAEVRADIDKVIDDNQLNRDWYSSTLNEDCADYLP